MGPNFDAARPFGRTQDGGDETAVPVEHDDGLEPIVVVVSVKQPKLLAAVNGIERVVEVEHNPLRHLCERRAVKIHHGSPHAQQGARVGQVFQPRERRLRGEVASRTAACPAPS